MRLFKEQDYKLFERLVGLTEREMLKAMNQFLRGKYGDSVITTKDYIVAKGEIPIALVAHMDTVFKSPVSDLYYDQKKGVMWSPQGLGADDRAGIFAIIKIIQSGLRPSIILTTGEEMGGVGACALTEKYPECPIEGLKYMIQLDRRGTNDCVFYDCYCPEFVDYVESFGFCERWGSFSDISFLMPAWEIVGTNLSVGYDDEHSASEILQTNALLDTISKVKRMLSEVEIPNFKYDELVAANSTWWHKGAAVYGQHCSKCKALRSEYELFPVLGMDSKIKYYCPDCIVGNVEWCDACGEAYEIKEPVNGMKLCKLCAEDLCTTSNKLKNDLDK